MSDKSKGGFALGDYVEVKDRIGLFYQQFPEGRLVTDRAEMWLEVEPPRVVVKALAYRTPDDPHPGVGWSWLTLPGKTPYTNGSELENCETSAWGRAIGSLGIGITGSIATGDEVRNKAGEEIKPDASGETLKPLGPATREGAVAKGSGRHSDLEWRQTPDGYHIGFLLEVGDNKARPQVTVEGALAVALFAAMEGGKASLEGQKVTVSGDVFEVRAPNRRVMYRIKATSIETPDWRIPATDTNSAATPAASADANDGATGEPALPDGGSSSGTSERAHSDDDLSGLPDEWKEAAGTAA